MGLTYNKLWKLLVDKKMSKADLRKKANISPNTMTKLRRDEAVNMSILFSICDVLGCNLSDIMEYTPMQENKFSDLQKRMLNDDELLMVNAAGDYSINDDNREIVRMTEIDKLRRG